MVCLQAPRRLRNTIAGKLGRHALQSNMKAKAETKKLWGGRFTGETDKLMEKFNDSLPFDKRLWHEDLQVCITCF
jgi:hypothetical protein